MPKRFAAQPIALSEVLPLRELYRQEMNCQIVHDSWLRRGFASPYLLLHEDRIAGYGAVTVSEVIEAGVVCEFYLLPSYRAAAHSLLRQLLIVSQASKIRVQTNDALLHLLLYDFAQEITSDTILFHDGIPTQLTLSDAIFRLLAEEEKSRIFLHEVEPVGEWAIEAAGSIVATGGVLSHYNPPYGDIHMEVARRFQHRGFGSFLVQALKEVCYAAGKKPAARCNVANIASRRTLEKAGMFPCARILTGRVNVEHLFNF